MRQQKREREIEGRSKSPGDQERLGAQQKIPVGAGGPAMEFARENAKGNVYEDEGRRGSPNVKTRRQQTPRETETQPILETQIFECGKTG